MARVTLTQISSRAWEHPADRAALNTLRAIPGFDEVVRKVAGFFGERATAFTSPEAPLVLSQDKLGLFSGSDGFVGSFTRFERSDALVQNAALLTAGGRAEPTGESKPDFVAYTLGKGLVIRAGTDQWPSQLAASPEVANATRRMWTLLSR